MSSESETEEEEGGQRGRTEEASVEGMGFNLDRWKRKTEFKEQGIYGAAAFVAGYFLIYVLASSDAERWVRRGAASTVDVVGWIFYGAHNVNMRRSDGIPYDFITEMSRNEGLSNPELVYLVPILVLIGTGYWVVRSGGNTRIGVEYPVATASSIAVGYAPLAFVGAVIFSAVNSSPGIINSVLFAGVVYPVLFGGVGGWLAYRQETGVESRETLFDYVSLRGSLIGGFLTFLGVVVLSSVFSSIYYYGFIRDAYINDRVTAPTIEAFLADLGTFIYYAVYNAHNIGVEGRLALQEIHRGAGTFAGIQFPPPQSPYSLAFYLILLTPVVLLILRGRWSVSNRWETSFTRVKSFATGAGLGLGYILGVLVLLFVGREAEALSDENLLQPDFVKTILVVGVVYPAFFGGIGGLWAHRTESTTADVPVSEVIYCPECGKEHGVEDEFCGSCGAEL